MLQAAELVQPALDEFYATLSSEQKARFNTLSQVRKPLTYSKSKREAEAPFLTHRATQTTVLFRSMQVCRTSSIGFCHHLGRLGFGSRRCLMVREGPAQPAPPLLSRREGARWRDRARPRWRDRTGAAPQPGSLGGVSRVWRLR